MLRRLLLTMVAFGLVGVLRLISLESVPLKASLPPRDIPSPPT